MPPRSGNKAPEQLKAGRQRKREAGRRGDATALSRSSQGAGAGNVMYNAHGHGVRSVFQKDAHAELEARRRLNCMPLGWRRAMPSTGIPFGEWFCMPHEVAGRPGCDASASASSPRLPFAFELPTRGWHTVGPPGSTATDDNVVVFDSHTHSLPLSRVSEKDASGAPPQDNSSGAIGEDSASLSEEAEEGGGAAAQEPSLLRLRKRVDRVERERFDVYCRALDNYPLPQPLRGLQLSSYERNIEVWRQLWRTVELCDVVVLVTDARYPIVHLHLGLLAYVARVEGKPCVLVLNKADLLPAAVLDRWRSFIAAYLNSVGLLVLEPEQAVDYLRCQREERREGAAGAPQRGRRAAPLVVLPFTANPVQESALGTEAMARQRRSKAKRRPAKLYEQLRSGQLHAPTASRGASSSFSEDGDGDGDGDGDRDGEGVERDKDKDPGDCSYARGTNFKGQHRAVRAMQQDRREHRELKVVAGMITELLALCRALAAPPDEATAHDIHVGFVGFPNVGKSSLLNCVRGAKAVSVSATAGHTKHLQTIPLPGEGMTLVDCPGLAAPVLGVPRALQAVLGTHQIAQTRDPQSGVAYLASHLPIETLYGLRRPPGADATEEWSAHDLCEAFALKRGFYVKHGKGALDMHRAAIAILQEAYHGGLCVFFAPPELDYIQSTQFREELKPYLLLPVFDEAPPPSQPV